MRLRVTVYTYPDAVTLDRKVRQEVRAQGYEGKVTIISLSPRARDQGIRQYIDVDVSVDRHGSSKEI